jgi:DNA polymerase
MKVPPTLVPGARIILVGEAPGVEEVREGRPFVGASGRLLSAMLHEAGILRDDISITNVCPFRPPGNDIAAFFLDKSMTKPGPEISAGMAELRELLDRLRPPLVIAAGRTALWALTGETSIGNWRGSTIACTLVPGLKVIPIYHPAAILRMFDWKAITVHDLRRCAREQWFPEIKPYEIEATIEPCFAEVMYTLDRIIIERLRVAVDIETIARHIACVGLAWSSDQAICIPFDTRNGMPFWSAEEEAAIIL